MINILGICGSPVKESNTELILGEALKAVEQDGIKIDIFTVQGKRIEDCRHCNWCMAKQSEGNFCAVKDGMKELFPKVIEADALMVASPVYLARMSGHLASVLDRIRCIHYGNHYAGGMKHKVGAGIAVSWFRNSGIETTLTSIHWAFLTYQMVIAVPGSLSTFGGAGLSSLSGIGDFDPKDKHQVCSMVDQGKDVFFEAAALKLFVASEIKEITSDAMEIHGAYGLSNEYDVAGLYQAAISAQVVMGSLDLQRVIVAKGVLRARAKITSQN